MTWELDAKAQRGEERKEVGMAGVFVRIRIFRIMGFSGLFQLVFGRQALIPIRLGWIFDYGEKRRFGESKS